MFWLESYKNVRMFSTIFNRPLILLPNNCNSRTEKLLKPPSAVQLNVSLCWKRYPVKCRWGGTWKAATGSRYSYVLVLNSLMPYNDSNAQNDSPSCVFRLIPRNRFLQERSRKYGWKTSLENTVIRNWDVTTHLLRHSKVLISAQRFYAGKSRNMRNISKLSATKRWLIPWFSNIKLKPKLPKRA